MKRVRNLTCAAFFVAAQCIMAQASYAVEAPIATDSRIRTVVYNPNDVFRVVLHMGFQTSIEFAKGEYITYISSGNSYAWNLSNVENRLFIRPLEENMITNMTIITSARTYNFELESKPSSDFVDEELVYVMRFFYPDTESDSINPVTLDLKEVALDRKAGE